MGGEGHRPVCAATTQVKRDGLVEGVEVLRHSDLRTIRLEGHEEELKAHLSLLNWPGEVMHQNATSEPLSICDKHQGG